MGGRSDTRERLIRTAERLLRTQGYSGTGLKDLTVLAKAPWGSLYHFFPEGKAQLAAAALQFAGGYYGAAWRRAFQRADRPGEAIESMFLGQARVLAAEGFAGGCAVAATTLDTAAQDEGLRRACERAFLDWLDAIAEGLRRYGAPVADADALALLTLSALEGAIALARARRSDVPLVLAGKQMRRIIDFDAAGWRATS